MKDLIDKGLLQSFLASLKGLFATRDVATASANGLMSAADKAKLDGLSGGGSDELLLALLSDTRELEGLTVQGGEFANAGEGWNTFTFPEPFDGVPLVLAQADGYGVDVKGVQEDRFLYMVTQAAGSGGLSVSKADYYVHTRASTSASYMVQASLVTDVSAGGSGGSAGVADAVPVRWAAIEREGE